MGLMVRRFYGRVGLAVVLLVSVTSLFFLYSWPIEIDPTSQEFLEDQRCPACYGQDLCHEVYGGRLTLKRWTRYAPPKNNYFCEFLVLQESAIYLFCCFSVTRKQVEWPKTEKGRTYLFTKVNFTWCEQGVGPNTETRELLKGWNRKVFTSAYRKPAFQPSAFRQLFIGFQPSAEKKLIYTRVNILDLKILQVFFKNRGEILVF